MFLSNLVKQNPAFAEAAINLHQDGKLPPDTYVLDLDMIAQNARVMTTEAHRLGLEVVAMTKQIGRNPKALDVLRANGVDSFVAVDLYGARAIHRAGHPIGNVGHLVQIPRYSASEIEAMSPQNWTVFTEAKATEAAAAALAQGRTQRLLARVYSDDGMVIETHAGGFRAEDVIVVADKLDDLKGGSFAGLTSYPALVYDKNTHTIHPTVNLRTMHDAAKKLHDSARKDIVVNAPGETSTAMLSMLANGGATQIEPGHGLGLPHV